MRGDFRADQQTCTDADGETSNNAAHDRPLAVNLLCELFRTGTIARGTEDLHTIGHQHGVLASAALEECAVFLVLGRNRSPSASPGFDA